jgi:hypothetical protein
MPLFLSNLRYDANEYKVKDSKATHSKAHIKFLERLAPATRQRYQRPQWTPNLQSLIKIPDFVTVFDTDGDPAAEEMHVMERIVDYVSTDKNSLLSLRWLNRETRAWVGAYRHRIFEEVSIVYPPVDASWRNLRSKQWKIFSRRSKHVKILWLRIRPSADVIPEDLDRRFFAKLFKKVYNLEALKLRLITGGRESGFVVQDSTGFESLRAEVRHLWSWSNGNLYDFTSRDLVSHHRPLVVVRNMLETVAWPLKVKALTIYNLSITGVQALRFDPFGGFKTHGMSVSDMFRGNFWMNIESLYVHMVPWWELGENDYLIEQPSAQCSRAVAMTDKPRRDAFHSWSADTSALRSLGNQADSRARKRAGRQDYKQGLYQLHQWLRGFSKQVRKLTWCWIKPEFVMAPRTKCSAMNLERVEHVSWQVCKSENPFLIDRRNAQRQAWFLPDRVVWRLLQHLTMASMPISMEVVKELLARMARLEILMVSSEFVHNEVPLRETTCDENGRVFSVVDIEELLWDMEATRTGRYSLGS